MAPPFACFFPFELSFYKVFLFTCISAMFFLIISQICLITLEVIEILTLLKD